MDYKKLYMRLVLELTAVLENSLKLLPEDDLDMPFVEENEENAEPVVYGHKKREGSLIPKE